MDAAPSDRLEDEYRAGYGRGGDPADGREQASGAWLPCLPCLGLLSLATRYGKVRLEAACMLALQIGACQYRHVNDILKSKREQSKPASASESVSPDHAHVRGPAYYQ
jgi:hypothetical protein